MMQMKMVGLENIDRILKKLPAKMEKSILKKSIRKGANILKAKARELAPTGSYSKLTGTDKYKKSHKRGTLVRSIMVRESSRSGRDKLVNTRGVAGRVAFFVETTQGMSAKYNAWYAHLVEFGVQPHSIKTGASIRRGKRQGGKLHPGFRARPFMRPALDLTGKKVIDEIGRQIDINLAKEIDKL